MEFLVILIFGWPAVLASLTLAIVGIITKRPVLVIAGGLLAAPHAYYLSGSPKIGIAGLLLPLSYIGSAISVRYRIFWLAWLFLLPQISLDAWLAYAVLTQL